MIFLIEFRGLKEVIWAGTCPEFGPGFKFGWFRWWITLRGVC